MPRKKNAAPVAANTPASTTAVAEATAEPHIRKPDWIDGPLPAPEAEPADESFNESQPATADQPQPRRFSNPYKAIFSSKDKGFEMGEHRGFKQRVFIFYDKPEAHVLATLKENGFTFRAAEKAWTIPANPMTRRLTDELAAEFAGHGQSMER